MGPPSPAAMDGQAAPCNRPYSIHTISLYPAPSGSSKLVKLMIKTLPLLLISILFLPTPAFAQMYDGRACKSGGKPSLKGDLQKGFIEELNGVWFGDYDNWSTSYLKYGKKIPKPTCIEDDECPDAYEVRDTLTCTYSAHAVIDRNPKTAWCEGKKGPGIGEILFVEIAKGQAIEISAGYAKSKKLHKANGRPHQIKVYVLQADETGITQYGLIYNQVRLLASHKTELKDVFGFQPLALPVHTLDPEKGKIVIAIEILSVYKGKRYSDTCISEVRSVTH